MPPCSGQSRPSPAGGREDAASLDRPCARRLRELAVGMEEYSRRGSNQRMRPKRARKPTISNRWFSGNFRLALTASQPPVSASDSSCHNAADSTPVLSPKSSLAQTTFVPSRKAESQLPLGGTSEFHTDVAPVTTCKF